MKNLFIILFIFFVSCKSNTKQNEGVVKHDADSIESVSRGEDTTRLDALMRAANPNQFHHTCANGYEDQTRGSEGVAASANVVMLKLGKAKIKSWWIGAYYYLDRPDGIREKDWVQWGYFVDRAGLDQAFYVYSISPIYGQKWPLTIINQNSNAAPLVKNTTVRFEIKRVPETTFWSFLRDGEKIFDVDLGVTSLDGILQSCTESWGTSQFNDIVHVDYLDTYKNGVWSHLPSGNIGSISWNLQGGTTRPEFKQSEHEFGGRIVNPINYLLW